MTCKDKEGHRGDEKGYRVKKELCFIGLRQATPFEPQMSSKNRNPSTHPTLAVTLVILTPPLHHNTES